MYVPKLIRSIGHLGCLTFLLTAHTAYSQVSGCKDPAATNYNAAATVNDGSCLYNTTLYTPPKKVDPISNALVESSGLQWAGNHLWSFNDGAGTATLFRMDTASDAILQTVHLGGTTNVDWEDIAFDGTHFYIGDFGNNANGARTDLKIYKFPLSAVPDYVGNPTVTIPAGQIDVIHFTYANQPQPPVASGGNNTKFDCEAMLVDEGKIHLFTKNWVDATTSHYVINGLTAGSYLANPVETLATNYLVTAADKVPGSNMVVLLGYQNTGTGLHFLHLLSDFSGGLYFNGNKRRIDLPSAAEMGQAEGITFRNSSYGYISNEKFERTVFGLTITVNQRLSTFNTEAFVPAYVLPVKLQRFGVKNTAGKNDVTWQFSEHVKQLRLEWSADRINFSVLHSYDRSQKDRYLHQPATADNCYRLSWKEESGAIRYSNISCLDDKKKTAVSNLVLRSNGELSFRVEAAPVREERFRLITTDGKLLAQTTTQNFFPGTHTIQFAKNLSQYGVLLLEMTGTEKRETVMLRVQ